jgi:acetyltransferase
VDQSKIQFQMTPFGFGVASLRLLNKLIHYDPACAIAFIAVDEQSQKMLGVVRLHDDTSGESAEFAILVRSRLKDHGVGWRLMKHMIEFSKRKDLKTVQGQVLSENTTMLAMCAELGFQRTIRTIPA